MNDKVPLLIYTILGLPLMAQYYSLTKTESIDKLWTNNNKNMYKGPNKDLFIGIHTISLILAFLSGVYLLYFLTYTDKKLNKLLIYSGLLLFIGWSLLWVPTLYTDINQIVLFGVGIGAFLTTIGLYDIGGPAFIAAAFLFIHTFFFDFLIWSF